MIRNRTGAYMAFAFTFLAIAVPHVAFGAGSLNPFPIIPQGGTCVCPGSAPDWGCILQIVQNVINAAIELGVVLCVIWIAYGGFSMMISGGSAEARSMAKTRLLNAVVGIAVILCAWLVVDWVMKVVYEPSTAFEGNSFGPWNSILAAGENSYCIQTNESPEPIVVGSVTLNLGENGSSVSSYTGTGGAGGTCTVPSGGACSQASLQGTCFAALGTAASEVCNLESAGGQVAILSGSDKLNSGKGPSYSVGLWQINLTTSNLTVGGKACKDAFSGTCSGAAIKNQGKVGWCSQSVINQSLYQACVAAAQNPQTNTQVACGLYNPQLSAWQCSASRCQISGAKSLSGSCAPGS